MIITYVKCRWCDLVYAPVDWLLYRVAGYCSKECQKKQAEAWYKHGTAPVSHPDNMLLHDKVKDDQRPEHGAEK